MASGSTDQRLRLSGVSFLNAQPILHGLLCGMGHDRLRLRLEEPAELARQLFEGDVDAALAPVAPLATHGGLQAVPGIAIGCDGPVRSVLLVADQPIETLDEILLDAASRTSVVLARLILRDMRGGREPRYCARPAREIIEGVGGKTGGLLIGDPALEAEGRFAHVVDLGAAWKQLTGLPFVFALWIARPGVLGSEDCALLQASLQQGLSQLPAIAKAWQTSHGGQASAHEHYLGKSIRYTLDGPALAGLREFYRRAAEAGLLPNFDLAFVGESRPDQPPLDRLVEGARAGRRLSIVEAMRLYEQASTAQLCGLAGARAAARLDPKPVPVAEAVHVSYSEQCAFDCIFCPLGKAKSTDGGPTREQLVAQVEGLVAAGHTRVVMDGGVQARLQLEWFESLFKSMQHVPGLELHAMSPDEIVALADREELALPEVVRRLFEAGLRRLFGGGAEVLTDRARRAVAPQKCSSRTWLDVLRLGHRSGMKTVATMMFGTGDSREDRVLHLVKLRDLQDETTGIVAFVPLAAQGEQALDVTEEDYMRLTAIARLVFDNVPEVLLPAGLSADSTVRDAGAAGVFGAVWAGSASTAVHLSEPSQGAAGPTPTPLRVG